MARPTSITIIAWMIIATSGVNALMMLFVEFHPPAQERLYRALADSPIPVPAQIFLGFLGLAISIVCALYMLKGAGWARVVYLSWGVVGLLAGIVNLGSVQRMLPGAAILAATAFFLTRKTANAFFTEHSRQQRSPTAGPDRPR